MPIAEATRNPNQASGPRAAGSGPAREGAQDAPKAGGEAERRGPADQLGAILNRGLDLAEASLSLGLTVINRVGEAAVRAASQATGSGAPPPEPGAAVPGPEAGAPQAAGGPPPDEPLYCITNRQPLAPGASVRVSFSINNDSMTSPKRVSVRVEGFAGEAEAVRIDAGRFHVKPARKTIAPLDFEKFVLLGTVPPETAPDVYHGAIVVSSGSEFRIPVRLVVLVP